jgi:hypothetical protein
LFEGWKMMQAQVGKPASTKSGSQAKGFPELGTCWLLSADKPNHPLAFNEPLVVDSQVLFMATACAIAG